MESIKAKLLQKQRVEWWLPGTKWGKWRDHPNNQNVMGGKQISRENGGKNAS